MSSSRHLLEHARADHVALNPNWVGVPSARWIASSSFTRRDANVVDLIIVCAAVALLRSKNENVRLELQDQATTSERARLVMGDSHSSGVPGGLRRVPQRGGRQTSTKTPWWPQQATQPSGMLAYIPIRGGSPRRVDVRIPSRGNNPDFEL